MTHSDFDDIAMLALGETDLPPKNLAHMLTCPDCRDELDRLSRVTRAVRENGPLDFQLEDPPPDLWARIRDDLTDKAPAPAQAAEFRPLERGRPRQRRRLMVWSAVGTAAALAAAATIGVLFAVRPLTAVDATAALSGLPAWSTSHGEASIRRAPDGSAVLIVSLRSPAVQANTGAYREVWLMNRPLTKLISVGILNGASGRFVLPADIVVADYPVVDVSEERVDGEPGHSGDSIVRGTLTRGTASAGVITGAAPRTPAFHPGEVQKGP